MRRRYSMEISNKFIVRFVAIAAALGVVALVYILSIALPVFNSEARTSVPTQTPVPTQTLAPTSNSEPVAVSAETPVPTQTLAPTFTAPPSTVLDQGDCSLTDGTAQIQITKQGDEWVVDPDNLKVVAGYNNTAPGHDISQLSGCDMWAEYESPDGKIHIIVVLRDDPTKPLAYLNDADGLFHIPQPKGGSFWVGPKNWNTADFSTKKPPLVYEMAAERNANQIRNNYDWPEYIYVQPLDQPKVFPAGYHYGDYYTGCTDITEPMPFYVAGTLTDDGYNASIGMEGCWIVVKLDGQWTYWENARDNVEYSTSAEAELFQSGATEQQVKDWIATQK